MTAKALIADFVDRPGMSGERTLSRYTRSFGVPYLRIAGKLR